MADPREIDVLHLIGALSPGGAERNLYYLAPSMAASRLRYGICCLARRGEFAEDVERAGVPVWELGYRKRYTCSSIWRLSRILRRHRVKVLHTHLFVSGLVGRLAGLLAGTPVMITHEHGKTLWKKWYHRLFERMALPVTDMRIAVSRDILSLRLKHEHTPPSKIRLVHNAVDPRAFEIAEEVRAARRQELGVQDNFVIGTVGRLVDAKAYDLLLDVAEDVCTQRPDARFVVVGEGPLGKNLRDLAASRGLTGKVLFLGKRTDIPGLMAAMDLYLITSRREGLPLALIEAMMSARAVVSTSVGGIPDTIVHDREGILVEPEDKAGLSGAILALMDDTDLRRSLGASARRKAVERYSPEKVLGELEKIYRGFLDR
jgi:glycosyltransferase involved in cell wall biosynthesis